MNERIFELAEQARDHALRYVADCKHYGYYMDHNEYDLQFREKFAELIVRQCMDLVKDCYKEPESGQSPYCTACASTIIEEHFGVEE